MRIDRRLTLIGIMLVVLSMTMATQYATTKIGYSYSIVHPSMAEIRLIGWDNSSDNVRVLRTASGTNTSGQQDLTIRLGNLTENQNKTYSAAFGIVNEESFPVNISHCIVGTTVGSDYMKVWLHGRPTKKASLDETSVLIWDQGAVSGIGNGSTAWTLAAGNHHSGNLNGTNVDTVFDNNAHVRYTVETSQTWATSGSHDFVWVQISIVIPDGASIADPSGSITFHFEATTIT